MNLQPLLAPGSVAIIGASNREGSLGHDTVEMIQRGGYQGKIYPVNPRYEEVRGLRCHDSLSAIGAAVDLAIFCLAAKRLEEQVDLALDAGARALVISANAVLESDQLPPLAQRIADKCNAAGIPICGHNAMGFYNTDIDFRACGFPAPDEGAKGGIAFITQSGSVFSTIAHNDPQLRFNLAIATGVETNIAVADYLDYALDQPSTRVAGLFLESIRKPGAFVATLRKAAQKRIPVVAMKVGRSELGARFALSHSGGMAGDDDALQAVFDRYGVIRTHSLEEFANTLLLFNRFPEVPQGGLVAVADSGGERNLLADEAETTGLEFANLSAATMQQLGELQEFGQEADNPLDPWGTGIEFERIFGESLGVMMRDDNAAVGLMSQDLRDGYFLTDGCVEAIRTVCQSTDKPVAFVTNFSGTRRHDTTAELDALGVPVLSGTRDALHAIRHRLAFRDFSFVDPTPVTPVDLAGVEDRLQHGETLQEHDALQLLALFGIPTVASSFVSDKAELEALKASLIYPVVLKTAVPGILHKSDVGGVVLNIGNFEALVGAYADLSARLGPAALIQTMHSGGHELIVGMKTDATFGALIVVGAGGVLAEYLDDKVIFLPGASPEEIERKLRSLKVFQIMGGVRGKKPVDTRALLDTIYRFAAMVSTLRGMLEEVDINPLRVSEHGAIALDALIVGRKT